MSTSENPAVSFEDLLATNRQLTQEILTGEQAIPVLRQMELQLARQFLQTQHFVGPVGARMEEIKKSLADPQAFHESYMTFLGDLQQFHQEFARTRDKLNTVQSSPNDPKHLPVLFAIADEFNQLMTTYDTVIHPHHRSLYTVIANEAAHVLVSQLPASEGQ